MTKAEVASVVWVVMPCFNEGAALRAAIWTAPPDTQSGLLRACAGAGARAVVAFTSPRRPSLPAGWQWLGSTNYSVHLPPADLRDASSATSRATVLSAQASAAR